MFRKFTDLFIKRKDTLTKNQLREKYGNFSGLVGIFCNFILATVKFFIGALTGSISVSADAVNNLSDSLTSVLSIAAFKIASKPADKKHPFGHARIEYIVSMILSFFLLTVGVDLLKSSFEKISSPVSVSYSFPILIILLMTVLLKIWLSFFYRFISKEIDSDMLKANAADSLSDALSTFAVLISALISEYTDFNLDGYVGVLVSVFLLVNAFKILNDTKNHILGTEPDAQLIKQIYNFAVANDEIIAIHDLYIHNYGPGRCFATFHAEVDGKKDIFVTHDAIDNVEKGILNEFGIQCTIHLDPIINDDEEVLNLKNQTSAIVEEINPEFSIHDFRFVPGDTHFNLIFDVLVPFNCKMSDEEIKNLIEIKIKKLSNSYFTVVTVDRGEKI